MRVNQSLQSRPRERCCPDVWAHDLHPFRRAATETYRTFVERGARTQRGPAFDGLKATYKRLIGTRRTFVVRPASDFEASQFRHVSSQGGATVLGAMFLSRGGTLVWGDGGSYHEGRVFGHYILSGQREWAQQLLDAAEPELKAAFQQVDGLEWVPDPARELFAISSGCIEVDRRGRFIPIL